MKMSRFSNTGAAAWLVAALLSLAALGVAKAEAADMHQLCRQVRNDDTIQDYSPALHDETVQAFKALAPDAQIAPDDSELRAQAQYRCMDGKVMVCFVGANLPCTKMNAARDNPGADGSAGRIQTRKTFQPSRRVTIPLIPIDAATAKLR
ncbi:hypothetical protein NKJ40_02365 [Mesorhizobium sp. M0119]|uniref:hypothetical protein n=1 Tax=unclassified Mesorhizobium TaxID=325217 RepID=UPI00333C52DD